MSRRRTPKKRYLSPDPVYDSCLVHMLVNQLMKKGKKSLAFKIFYSTIQQIGETSEQNPLSIVEQAIRNATPLVEVKAKRVRGSTHQVPRAVPPERGTALGIRWILGACRKRSGRNMVMKLTNELVDASKKMGTAVRKREEIHRMAEANKAFAKSRA